MGCGLCGLCGLYTARVWQTHGAGTYPGYPNVNVTMFERLKFK